MKKSKDKISKVTPTNDRAFAIKYNKKLLLKSSNYKEMLPLLKNKKLVCIKAKKGKYCKELCTKKQDKKWFFRSIFSGTFVGFINGFWGGGGGMVCVPTLTNVLKLRQKQAQATTIFIILPLSMLSVVVYYLNGNIKVQGYSMLLVSFTIGGLMGALILKQFSNLFLKGIFACLIIAGGLRLIL